MMIVITICLVLLTIAVIFGRDAVPALIEGVGCLFQWIVVGLFIAGWVLIILAIINQF